MLLRYTIPVMAQFMHKHVEQHVRSGLGFSETTDNFLLEQIVGHTKSHEEVLVRIEKRLVHGEPKVLIPGVQINSSAFFPMIEQVTAVVVIRSAQSDSFQLS